MRVFIFEGIATSGKSTIIQQLKISLSSLSLIVVEEEDTHVPIMKDTVNNHVEFYKNLITQTLASDVDLVIFDRLYLTQAFRAKTDINSYKEVEQLLLPYQPLTVFLKVEEETIEDRILNAAQHRESNWKEYIKTKGQTTGHIAEYYANQQASQLQLLKTSTVPFKIFDTTKHNYQEITEQLAGIATQN